MSQYSQQERIAWLNARLIDPLTGLDTKGALLSENGLIVDFGPELFRKGAPSVSRSVDCRGYILAPGLMDARVTCGEPGASHKETMASLALAALSGGVTSVIQTPETDPICDDSTMVEALLNRAKSLNGPRWHVMGSLTQGLKGTAMSEIALMKQAGAVAFTDGEWAVHSASLLKRIFTYGRPHQALIVQTALDKELAGSGIMNAGELAARLGLAGIPALAEWLQLSRDLLLAEDCQARLHCALVTTSRGLSLITEAKAKGIDVTVDTAPHYFLLNENAVNDYRSFAKVLPPLRGEDDRLALIKAMAKGVIDMVVSDHRPQDQDSKRLPFAQAEFGVCGVETLLPSMLSLVHNGHLSLHQALRLVTINPRQRFGLRGGKLAAGEPADLVLIDSDYPFKVKSELLKCKSHNTAFDGMPMQGRALLTIVGGNILWQHADFNL